MKRSVLFISHDASLTGAPLFLVRFLQWLRANADVQFIILLGQHGPLTSEFEALGRVHLFEPYPTLAYRGLRKLGLHQRYRERHLASLRTALGATDVRLIYSNTIVNGRILEFLSFLECPVVCHVHELQGVIESRGSDNLSVVRHRTREYIAVSGAVARNLSQRNGIDADLIHTVHGFVPTDHSDARVANGGDASTVRQMIGASASSFVVCACGAIEARKGTDLFLEVAELAVRLAPAVDVHFVWVGGSAEQVRAHRRLSNAPRFRGRVHFAGAQNDVHPFYLASDVFLLTSREDPFPLVMLEAALREKPIICFDECGGAPEFVGDDAGVVVPKLDVTTMTHELLALLSSGAHRQQMGMNARRKVLANHDLHTGAEVLAGIVGKYL